MKKHNFKIGDKVKRVAGRYNKMVVDDCDTIIDCDSIVKVLKLEIFGTGHISDNFIKIPKT